MKKLAGFFGVLALMAVTPLAHANYQISYQIGAGAATVCANSVNNQLASCPGASGVNASVSSIQGTSNSPGGLPFGNANQFGDTVTVTATQNVTILLWFAAQDFTFPTAPPNIFYASSLDVTSTTGSGTVALESCVDTSNGLAPPTSTFCSAPGASLTNNIASYLGASSSPSNTVSTTITSLAGNYSLSQMLTLTLKAGSQINIQSSQVLTPVPEPASILLLGGMLLGAGTLFRRKQQVKRS